MHASDPLIRKSQTTGSLVVELHPDDKFRIFVTGGSAPCLSAFKPFIPAAPFADLGVGADHYSDQSFWWRHEAFHVNAMLRYKNVLPMVQKYILEEEANWTAKLPAYAWDRADPLLTEISHGAFRESDSQEKAVVARMKKIEKTAPCLSSWFWKRMSRRSGVPLV
jgi:dipeptidase